MTANIDEVIQLTFDGIDQVPPEFDVWLADGAWHVTQDLRRAPHYSFPAPREPKRLTLVVGRPAFIERELGTRYLPAATFEAPRNFPNPFRTSTAIHYTLVEAERVTLEVYSVLGEKVSTLLSHAAQDAGRHLIAWDGTTSEGRPVASGLYILRFRTDTRTATTTAVVVR